jgi:hypothetical protein
MLLPPFGVLLVLLGIRIVSSWVSPPCILCPCGRSCHTDNTGCPCPQLTCKSRSHVPAPGIYSIGGAFWGWPLLSPTTILLLPSLPGPVFLHQGEDFL